MLHSALSAGNTPASHDADSTLSHPLDTPSPGPDDLPGPLHGANADGKRLRERRVMPARLRRVSSLLTGSIIEEEIAGAAAKEAQTPTGLAGSTTVILTTESIPCEPLLHTMGEHVVMLQHRQQIETPDFRTRDETEVMGKTRSLRSEEDTSDAAFERRHRKADNAEKRLRRWEKDNLKKDRQKLVDRIERLKAADARILAPILTAREQRQRPMDGESSSVSAAADAAAAASSSVYSAAQQAKLEHLRDELIEECKVMLRRYDALLTVPVEETPVVQQTGKRKKMHDDSSHTSNASNAADEGSLRPRRSISVSGAFARKASNATASSSKTLVAKPSGLRASSSTSDLPDGTVKKPNTKYSARDIKARRLSIERTPKPFTDKDGNLRAEHTYANIHARTSGGRFAPKKALSVIPGAEPGSKSKINTKTGKTHRSPAQARKPAAPAVSPTEVPQKRRPGRPRKDETASTSAAAAAPPSGPSSTASTPTRTGRPRGRPPKSPVAVTSAGSSAERTDGTRTRRVKLILNRNGKSGNSSSASSSSMGTPTTRRIKEEDEAVQDRKHVDADGDEAMDSEGETDAALPASSTPARSALTLEEAQALLAKAMADGEDDDQDAKDAAAAAAAIYP